MSLLNLLRHTEILIPKNSTPIIDYPPIIHPSQVTLLKSEHAGLFVRHADLKNNAVKGEIIGEVVNVNNGEVLQNVIAQENGFLFTIREHPIVYPGALIARIARKNIA